MTRKESKASSRRNATAAKAAAAAARSRAPSGRWLAQSLTPSRLRAWWPTFRTLQVPWWLAASSLLVVVGLAAWGGTRAAAAAALVLAPFMAWAAWRAQVYSATREATRVGSPSAKLESGSNARRLDAVVLYRPLRSLPQRDLRGVEAALRWRHPTLGSHTPESWPEAMDDDTASVLLDAWLASALPQFARWWPRLRTQGCRGLWLRVPTAWSALADFGPRLTSALARHGLEPSQLVLRVPLKVEGGRPRLPPSVLDLQAQGVALAVDGFGEGPASLTHLEHLPVRTVCLAASFVERAGPDTPQRWVVESTAKLAASMGMSTLAEAVHDPRQVPALAALGCRFGVGDACGRWTVADEWSASQVANQPHQAPPR